MGQGLVKHQREGACVHDTEVPELGRTATTPAETRVRASLRGPQLGAKRSPARVASRKHRGNQSHAHRTHQRTPGTSGVQLASARTARPSRSAPLRTELCRRGPKRGPTNTAPPPPRALPAASPEPPRPGAGPITWTGGCINTAGQIQAMGQ